MAGVTFIGLAAAGISPFSRIGATFDSEWFDIVRLNSSFIFVLSWGVLDWCLVVATAALLSLALMFADQRARSFLAATAAVGVGGLSCALLGGDILRNVLVLEVQPMRVLWLVTIVAHVFVLPAFSHMSTDDSDTGRLLRGGLIVGVALLVATQLLTHAIVLAAPVLLVTCLLWGWLRMGGRLRYSFARYCAGVVLGLAIGGTLFLLYLVALEFMAWPHGFLTAVCAFVFTILALGIALVTGLRTQIRRPILLVETSLAIGLFCAGLLAWDQRQPWDRFIEDEGAIPPTLVSLLPQQANVYWENGVKLMWFRLQRPMYFSCWQGAGIVFFRGTAMEYKRRAETFSRLHTLDFGNSVTCPSFGTDVTAAANVADLRYVCEHEPRLDYLVLLDEVPEAPSRVWQAHTMAEIVTFGRGKSGHGPTVRHVDRYFIYGCIDFRGN